MGLSAPNFVIRCGVGGCTAFSSSAYCERHRHPCKVCGRTPTEFVAAIDGRPLCYFCSQQEKGALPDPPPPIGKPSGLESQVEPLTGIPLDKWHHLLGILAIIGIGIIALAVFVMGTLL